MIYWGIGIKHLFSRAARLNRLEESLARCNQPVGVVFETSDESNRGLLPIAELKHLAEMEKRFR